MAFLADSLQFEAQMNRLRIEVSLKRLIRHRPECAPPTCAELRCAWLITQN